MVVVIQSEFLCGRIKCLPFLVVKEIIGRKLLVDGYAVGQIKVVPLIVIEVCEASIPAPLPCGDFGFFGNILKGVVGLAG